MQAKPSRHQGKAGRTVQKEKYIVVSGDGYVTVKEARPNPDFQSNFRPKGKMGLEPLILDVVDGNNLLAIALTAATPDSEAE